MDWYTQAREQDGRTDDEVMSEIRYKTDVLKSKTDKCPECGLARRFYMQGIPTCTNACRHSPPMPPGK